MVKTFDGMRNFLEKYLFISDDTIELQMLQGFQNWSWISQGVLGSNFRGGHRKLVAWAIQLYMCTVYKFISVVLILCLRGKYIFLFLIFYLFSRFAGDSIIFLFFVSAHIGT
jgi:hypothetical protein